MDKKNWLLILALVVAATAGGVLAYLQQGADPAPPETDGALLDTPRSIPHLELTDHHGADWTPARFEGDWTLVFFGFTNCPDVCPQSMIQMNQVDRILRDNGRVNPPSVVFVTVDPVRDTPEQLAEYVPYFNEEFLGVTGDPEDIATLTEAMGIPFMPPEEEGADDYLVDHGAALTLVGPDGNIRAYFNATHETARPHDPEKIARDLEKMIPYLEDQVGLRAAAANPGE